MTSDMDKKLLDRFQLLCSRSEQCSAEVYRKVVQALEGDELQAAEIVSSLIADGYVSDSRYAAAFARDKAHLNGWGPVKIRFQLRSKGVNDASISAALETVDAQAAGERLHRLLEAKCRSLTGDPNIKLKLLKFALGRGYAYDQIAGMVDEILANG